jgi:DNA-binding PadR family transcriptional regulator
MPDPGRNASPPPSPGRPRRAGGRQPNPVYELFVLGELLVQPLHGYVLHEIVNLILGPFHRLSWGTLYPLIRRLEDEGLITSQTQEPRVGVLQRERGSARKVYTLTEQGHERFLSLMLDPGDYTPDYPDLFAMKFTKFGYLTPAQRRAVLDQYCTFLLTLRDHYRTVEGHVAQETEILETERPYILRWLEERIGTLERQLAWLERQMAEQMADTADQ